MKKVFSKNNEMNVGDVVKILPGSQYYSKSTPSSSSNPCNITGLVVKISMGNIHVVWSNHTSNQYNSEDLTVVYDAKSNSKTNSSDRDKLVSSQTVLPKDERIDIDKVYEINTLEEFGLEDQQFLELLIRYHIALERAEDIVNFYDGSTVSEEAEEKEIDIRKQEFMEKKNKFRSLQEQMMMEAMYEQPVSVKASGMIAVKDNKEIF